ncbi:MAG TPA: acetyl-CoA carboxylase, carboxyltransferase subunit beta [bacterium]
MAAGDLKADSLWVKCLNCNEIIYRKEVEKQLYVCPKCSYHFRISASEWINLLADPETFFEMDKEITSIDVLNFKDKISYQKKLEESERNAKTGEAIVTGRCRIESTPVFMGIFEFSFMGGSMGSAVGEKITRLFEKGAEELTPVIIISSSGGARMQEGIFALMQMSKTTAALRIMKSKKVPYISVLSDPTTGGVAASFAYLGDVIISEPKALIGFAGKRVIEDTIKQKLPADFQRAEFALQHGMIDMIVERKNLKKSLAQILHFIYS